MTDIWCVLLQTLNVSGAAALLLAVKAIFRDKLPPKWQFGIWGILAAVMLVPAGMGGRQLLVPWAKLVELVKVLCGELGFSAVTTPLPLLSEQPKDIIDWLYVLYFTGVLIQLGFYGTAYVRLRRVLNRGREIRDGKYEEFYRMGCRVMAVDGLSSAFVCGVFRPILAVPAEQEPGDQVLLHEKLHLKNRDTAWSVVICLFKSLHWCNPFLRWCAGVAGNDLEARCDQQVLERLEGEQRRAYGRTLLAMANDRHARIPGATAAKISAAGSSPSPGSGATPPGWVLYPYARHCCWRRRW
jgi:hypothetical protein